MHDKISANKLSEFKKLAQKKFRDEQALFPVEGVKLLEEVLHSDFTIQLVCATESWWEKKQDLLSRPFSKYLISERELQKLSNLKTPNQVFAVVKMKEKKQHKLATDSVNLAFESLRDPGNLGTVLRIADWFGFEQIFCSSDSVDVFNPKTIQSSMGSIFRVKVVYLDLVKEMASVSSEIPIYGAVLSGKSIYKNPLPDVCTLVFGSESHGLSAEMSGHLHHRISIPSFGNAESLNVAASVAVFCSEIKRAVAKKASAS